MKKETRGRKPKKHEPVKASFDEVLKAIGKSKYKDEKTIKPKKKLPYEYPKESVNT